jgi:hypothetical protein
LIARGLEADSLLLGIEKSPVRERIRAIVPENPPHLPEAQRRILPRFAWVLLCLFLLVGGMVLTLFILLERLHQQLEKEWTDAVKKGDHTMGIVAYTIAIKADPQNPTNYYDRAYLNQL